MLGVTEPLKWEKSAKGLHIRIPEVGASQSALPVRLGVPIRPE